MYSYLEATSTTKKDDQKQADQSQRGQETSNSSSDSQWQIVDELDTDEDELIPLNNTNDDDDDQTRQQAPSPPPKQLKSTRRGVKSIRNRHNDTLLVSRGDYVIIESRVKKDALNTNNNNTNNSNVYSELVNESSNTNYSADDMSDVMATGNSFIETYCAQVKTIWIDSSNNGNNIRFLLIQTVLYLMILIN